MSFYQNCICLAFKIDCYETFVNFACKRCCCISKPYIVIKDLLFYLKCLKCVCANKLCVNMSWASLNYTRENLFFKVIKNEIVLIIVIMRLLRNKKMLKKVDAKAKRKTQYLLSSIKKLNVIKSLNCFVANTLIKTSFIIWFSLAMLNDFSNVDGISR